MTEIPIDFTKKKSEKRFETISQQYRAGEISLEEMRAQILGLSDDEVEASGINLNPQPIAIEEAERLTELVEDVWQETYEKQREKLAWENKDDPRAKEIIRRQQKPLKE